MPATTPMIKGDRAVATRMMAGRRELRVGDSITSSNAERRYRYASATPVGGFVQGLSWSFALSSAGNWTSTNIYNPAEFVDTMQITSPMKVDFLGGTSAADTGYLSNRTLASGIGPQYPNSFPADSASTRSQVFSTGVDWLGNTLSATGLNRPVTVRLPVYKHPGGPVNADSFYQVRFGGTVVATSGYFNGYAATPGWVYVDAVIPAGTSVSGGALAIDTRFRASTATEVGKRLVLSSRVEFLDTSVAGLVHFNVAVGGMGIESWNDPAQLGQGVLNYFALIAVDVLVFSHGQNNAANNTASQFATKTKTFVDRVKTARPAIDVCLLPTYSTVGYPGTGGEVGEPYFVTGMSQSVDANPGWLLLNLHRATPSIGALDAGYRQTWQETLVGMRFYAGTIVHDTSAPGTTKFAAKLDVTKGTVAPKDDLANWVAVHSQGSLSSRPDAAWANPSISDGTHNNPGGLEVVASTVEMLIRWAATPYTGIILLQGTA